MQIYSSHRSKPLRCVDIAYNYRDLAGIEKFDKFVLFDVSSAVLYIASSVHFDLE